MAPDGGDEEATDRKRDRHLDALRDLTSAISDAGAVEARIERVLEIGCEHLGYPNGLLATVTGDEYEIRIASGEAATAAKGVTTRLDETFCRYTLAGQGEYVVLDTSESAQDDPARAAWGIESYLGIPISVEDELYGTLCFTDQSEPRAELDEWQKALLRNLKQWVESELEREQIVALRERDRRLLEATFNSPNVFVGILDTDGTVLRVNDTALDFVDAEPSDVRGVPFHETPWWNHDAEIRARCEEAVTRASEGERVNFEARHVGADGDQIRTAVTVRPVFEDGTVSEIIAEGQDITDLKNREEQMEFFNSILRHDILNGMNVIRARAEYLDSELDEYGDATETVLEWSDDIIDLTLKVRSVLSTLSGDGLTEPKPVALDESVDRAAKRATSMDGECTISMDVPDVSVSANDLLVEVFGNVFVNVVDHAGPDPTVEVTTTVGDDTVSVAIDDDGPGVPPEERRAVFERGSKRTESAGTGFGLYFVDAMIDSYGGDIWIEESDLGGARFVVELQRSDRND